jgi:hypothetical protein
MNLKAFWQSLETSSLGDYIASSPSAFPLLESIHVIAIVTVFGTLTVMDLRLLGLTSRNAPVTSVSRDTLRLTWMAFVLAAITGSLLFVSKAGSYTINPYFQWKMGLIVLAGINMLLFHFKTWPSVTKWDLKGAIPTAAKVAGALSLALWMVIIFCGRVIGFTLGVYV